MVSFDSQTGRTQRSGGGGDGAAIQAFPQVEIESKFKKCRFHRCDYINRFK
jgi:hypothetical protein